MAKEKKEKKPKSKARKIVEWVLTGLFLLVFGFFGVMTIIAQATKGQNYGVPNYGGYQVMVILTDSMEPKYKVDSAVIVKKVKPSTLKEGDDVTFMWDIYNDGNLMPMTHRLTEVHSYVETDGSVHYNFVAHGINTASKQCAGDIHGSATADCTNQHQSFNENLLLGKVVGHSMFLGGVFNFMTTPWGLLILLLVPAMYLIVSSGIDIVKAAKSKEEEEEKLAAEGAANADGENPPTENKLSNLSAEDKERLKKELLNQMLEEKMKGGKKNEQK